MRRGIRSARPTQVADPGAMRCTSFPRADCAKEIAHAAPWPAGRHAFASSPCRRWPTRRSTSPPPATRTWSTTSTTISARNSRRRNPGVHVRAVGTGPGDPGSLAIEQKLSAEQKSGAPTLGHRRRGDPSARRGADGQRGPAREIPRPGLDRQARHQRRRRTTRSAPMSTGYVLPMFDSQIAIAYNPAVVKDPPQDLRRARAVGEGSTRSSSAITASRAAWPASASSWAGSTPTAASARA